MTITITPTRLSGSVTPPPSKSQAHRLLIAAALAEGESVISNVAFSQDIEATIRCLEELGAHFERVGRDALGAPHGETLRVTGMGANAMSPLRRLAYPHLDCGESGSTLRFLIPIALAVRGGGVFTGSGRLMDRPLTPYFDIFREKGIFFEQKDGVLTVTGLLTPGVYELPGNVSSQFFTGLLYALPLLNGPSAIVPTTPLESEGYIRMTLQAMDRFGVMMPATMSLPPQYHPMGNQIYHAANAAVEADWSQAGFWYAAQFLGNTVTVDGLDPNSAQGDRVIVNQTEALGAELETGLHLELDVSGCPDLVPPLAAMAALRAGETTRLTNAARLRIKESDRLASVTQVLNALGADVTEGPDSLAIRGKEMLSGGVTVDSFNDHRVAMMAAIAATRCERPVTITGAECVAKSYPDFWEEYERLGGQIQNMDPIKLVTPTEEQLDQVWAYRQECLEAGSDMDGCGPMPQAGDPAQWLAEVRSYTDPATLPEGLVLATQFLAVRELDGRVVGMIQIRHYFSGYLEKYGGHIGYSVRPSERRKGYAREQLRQALIYCREALGLERVLITCEPNNEGSRRTILANGGVYENTVHEPGEDIDLERYWIAL